MDGTQPLVESEQEQQEQEQQEIAANEEVVLNCPNCKGEGLIANGPTQSERCPQCGGTGRIS